MSNIENQNNENSNFKIFLDTWIVILSAKIKCRYRLVLLSKKPWHQ